MDLAKDSIKNLKKYNTNKIQYKIKLDANEGKGLLFQDICKNLSDFNMNFYPDNEACNLKEEIKNYLDVDPSNIVVGNGSSEMIDIVIKTFVDKDEFVLSFTPTFSMYSIYSQMHSAKFVGVECNENFSVNIDKLIEKSKDIKPKVIFLCNPNNPTGYLLTKTDIKKILDNTNSIIVVDEAYMEFAEESMVDEINNYNNLIVLRTFSKAFSLAAIRVGYMIANESIINIIEKVKSPYNLNTISQFIATNALKNKNRVFDYIENIKIQRDYIYTELNKMGIKAYKSYGNFIFFSCNIDNLLRKLSNKGILIREFSQGLKGYYRVTVGEKNENEEFLNTLKEIVLNENS
jgi:histidinol-phosphate aminotransferase